MKDWVLTPDAFDRFLAGLDADREQAGEKYEVLRLKLIKYFEWQGSPTAEDLADETVNRVTRKLFDGEPIRNLINYIFGTARYLAHEHRKELLHQDAALKELPNHIPFKTEKLDNIRIGCFEKCLSGLPEADRELIITYYSPEKREKIDEHRRLADKLSISLNSMRLRVHRIKQRLEKCTSECEARHARK